MSELSVSMAEVEWRTYTEQLFNAKDGGHALSSQSTPEHTSSVKPLNRYLSCIRSQLYIYRRRIRQYCTHLIIQVAVIRIPDLVRGFSTLAPIGTPQSSLSSLSLPFPPSPPSPPSPLPVSPPIETSSEPGSFPSFSPLALPAFPVVLSGPCFW